MTPDDLLDHLERVWSSRDPVPAGLVERMQALVAAELELRDTDLDYELLLLIERTNELAGVRGGEAYTLQFSGENLDLLVRAAGGEGERTTRLDGWVVPAAEVSVRVERIDGTLGSWDTSSDERGRFEFGGLAAGMYRLWLTREPGGKPFGTPAFEI